MRYSWDKSPAIVPYPVCKSLYFCQVEKSHDRSEVTGHIVTNHTNWSGVPGDWSGLIVRQVCSEVSSHATGQDSLYMESCEDLCNASLQ